MSYGLYGLNLIPLTPMQTEDMEKRLKESFKDCDVMVTDLTGQSDHYEVRIASIDFQGLNRVQQHQAVMAVFEDELKTGKVHALVIKTLTK